MHYMKLIPYFYLSYSFLWFRFWILCFAFTFSKRASLIGSFWSSATHAGGGRRSNRKAPRAPTGSRSFSCCVCPVSLTLDTESVAVCQVCCQQSVCVCVRVCVTHLVRVIGHITLTGQTCRLLGDRDSTGLRFYGKCRKIKFYYK